MIDIAREVARVRSPMLAISAVAWIALAAGPGLHVPGMDVLCSTTDSGPADVAATLSVWLTLNPPAALAAGWAIMVVAMMSPLVIPEIHHIRFTSLTRRRTRSIALFAAGYGGTWMAGGAALTLAAAVALARVPDADVRMALVALIACLWQASPWKQRCLNGCHDNPPLRIFGREADLDAFRFGCMHGLWCVGSCTGLMLIPLSLPMCHLPAMAAVAMLIFCERLEDPEPPRWKMRGLAKASRMTRAQILLRWRVLRRRLDPLPGG